MMRIWYFKIHTGDKRNKRVEKHKLKGDGYEKFYDLLSWQISSQTFIGAFGATC